MRTGSATLYFLHTDHLGNNSITMNVSKAVLARTYQPYGTVLSSTGAGTTNHGLWASMRTAAA